MTDAEVISAEVLEILAEHDEGLTAQAIYDKSRIAMSLQEVTGALNRLRNATKVQRGSDKRWRTMNAAERQRAAPKPSNLPEPARPARVEPERITPKAALDTVQKVAKLAEQPAKMPDSYLEQVARDLEFAHANAPPERATDCDWLIQQLEEESDAAQVRLDRYVAELKDEVLTHLVEMCLAANNALEAARRARS